MLFLINFSFTGLHLPTPLPTRPTTEEKIIFPTRRVISGKSLLFLLNYTRDL